MAQSSPRLLGGRYEVRSLIGRGGMAQVHLGRDTRLSRLVAIKMLRVDLARDAVFQTRFRREAQAAASLNHPNIVAVYDTGEEPIVGADGKTVMVPYIVMEYVEGHTVKELLSDGTPVPIPEAVEITEGVLSALEYSHAAGLVHRDIKPGNVMLTNSGKVKVMDFGIARAIADSQATMTSANAVVGTALYLSPEQARGEKLDERSDIYSAGCVLFELLTGRAPFAGDSAVSLAYQHVSEPPPIPSSIAPDVPIEIDQVVLKALAKDPSQRYASAGDMSADLMRAAQGLPITAPPVAAWATAATAETAVNTPVGEATQTIAYTGPLRSHNPQAFAANAEGTQTTGSIPIQTDEDEKKKSVVWIWILVILALALVAGAIVFFVNSGKEKDPETVAVPDVVGMTQAEARQAVTGANLEFKIGDPVTSDDIAKDLIAKVDPEVGEMLEVGSLVTVHPSSGPETSGVPALEGKTLQEAEELLTEAGFVVGTVTREDNPSYKKDVVISSDPQAGFDLPKGSKVNLVVSSGDVEVPSNLLGTTQQEAVSRLENLGFQTTINRQYSTDYAKDLVMSVSPTGKQPQGTTITLTVSDGPEPAPTDAEIPTNLVGRSSEEVIQRLTDLGFNTSEVRQPSNDIAKDLVISVNPTGKQPLGTRVTVTVSDGPAQE